MPVPSTAVELPDSLSRTVASPPPNLTISLGETIAAPLPEVVGTDVPVKATLSSSILPRVEPAETGVRLVPNSGPRYEAGKVLGTGGMGEVALAEDRDIGRKVALKRLHGPGSASSLARFVDEVRTVGQLEHPNIVPIHDVGVDETGAYFFVMKYLAGETLESIIEKLRSGDEQARLRYTMARRTEIFVGILRALEYAHQRGIIHRDIKPANVMIGHNGEVILMDWGVARPIAKPEADGETLDLGATDPHRASATHAGSLIGTPLYMSPEQAAGKNSKLDARSDLYSACQVFYELLALEHRFATKENLIQLLAAIQSVDCATTGELRAAHLAKAQVPVDLSHFLRKGLRLRPEDRWQSASDMIFELGMIADGRCRVNCPATGMKRATREITSLLDRRPGVAMAAFSTAAASLVALIGVAIYGLMT
jgi:eukaryotic-like serine/threonine-protein kinase